MSFPKIPDLDPYINITFEDAVNLLLTSIALEEISLSKLIDAETHKILCVVEDCKEKHSRVNDALAINKSVDETIKNIIKLQMLLQFKLENVKEMLPCISPHPKPCSFGTMTCCNCSLIGKWGGVVTNECDKFYGHVAVLQANVLKADDNDRTLRYFVKNEEYQLCFSADNSTVKIKCTGEKSPEKMIVYGEGQITCKSKKQPKCSSLAKFVVRIYKKDDKTNEFKITLSSDKIPEINHDSGMVQIRDSVNAGDC